MRIIDEYKSQNAKVATANEGDLPGLAAKGVVLMLSASSRHVQEIFDARREDGHPRLLATTDDNAGDGHGAGPVPFDYGAAVGDPGRRPGPPFGWAARRGPGVDWKPPKREPKAAGATTSPW